MDSKSLKKFNRSLSGIANQFEYIDGLFLESQENQEKKELIESKYPDLDETVIKKAKGLPMIKYFAIILETMLAFRGFEFLFLRVIEVDLPRWSIFIVSFIASVLIIEGTYRLMNFLQDVTESKSIIFASAIPLLVVPGANLFAYIYDETPNKGIFLFLAIITFAINFLVIFLLSSLSFKEEYSSKYIKAYNDLRKIEQDEKRISTKFRRRYKIIKNEGMTLFSHYKELIKSESFDINLSQEYLWIIQHEIFKNRNVDFGKNIDEIEDNKFINWWKSMSKRS